MPANPWAMFGNALEKIIDGTIDVDTDAFRMVLVGTGYVPDQAAHVAWSSISANEITGTGYTANGKPVTLTVSRTGLAVTLDCNDQSWANSTLSGVAYAVIVRDADANGALVAGDIPLAYCELQDGGSLSTVNAPLSVTTDVAGIFTTSAAAAV